MSEAKHEYYFKSGLSGGVTKFYRAGVRMLNLWLKTRILSPALFGAMVLGTVVVNIVSELSSLGLNQLIMYRVPKLLDNDQTRRARELTGNVLVNVFLFVCLTSAVLILSRDFISYLFGVETLTFWLLWLPLLAPLATLRDVHSRWLQANERLPESFALNGLIPLTVKFIGFGLVWYYNFYLTGIVIVIFCERIISLTPWLIKEKLIPEVNFVSIGSGDWGYSFQMIGSRLGRLMNQNLDILMLSWLGHAGQTAVYKVGTSLAGIGQQAHALVGNIFKPRLSKFMAREDKDEFKREYFLFQQLGLAAVLAITSVLVLGGTFFPGLFGQHYEKALPVILIVLVSKIVLTSTGKIGGVMKHSGRSGWVLTTSLVAAAVNLVGNIFLIPLFGAPGAAVAWSTGIIVANLMLVWLVRTKLELSLYPPEVVWKTLVGIGGVLLLLSGLDRWRIPSALIVILPALIILKNCYPKILTFLGVNLK